MQKAGKEKSKQQGVRRMQKGETWENRNIEVIGI